jgi:hypothetical protein
MGEWKKINTACTKTRMILLVRYVIPKEIFKHSLYKEVIYLILSPFKNNLSAINSTLSI